MFDFFPRPERTYAELILKKMRPGDIHTHVFAQQFPILLPDGKINPIMAEARARGVIFDVGHGAGSFWFRNAVPAVRQGFIPDSISTDLHTLNYTVLSMTQVMSKFLAMGVPLNESSGRSTVNPAREIRRPELGTLSVGKEADIAVLEQLNGKFSYIDCGFARMDGTGKLIARMTVRAGRILYDPSGLSMVEWEKARPQYFSTPRWVRRRQRERTTIRGNKAAGSLFFLSNAPASGKKFRWSGTGPCRHPEVRHVLFPLGQFQSRSLPLPAPRAAQRGHCARREPA